MSLPVAATWFERSNIDADITLLWEPHVALVDRCNIWHVRGRERDLLVDSGLGVRSLRQAARDLFEKPVIAVATHSHYDHTGNFHEFEVRAAHPAEVPGVYRRSLALTAGRCDSGGRARLLRTRRLRPWRMTTWSTPCRRKTSALTAGSKRPPRRPGC